MEVEPIPTLSLSERDRRWAAVRERMEREDLDAIVTTPNTTRFDEANGHTRYLSQIPGNAVGAAMVFPRQGDPTVFVAKVPGAAHWKGRFEWVEDVRDIGDDFRFSRPLAERLKELGVERGRIGVGGLGAEVRAAEGNVLLGVWEGLREDVPQARMTGASALLNDVRYVKGAEEIALLERSVRNAEAMARRLAEEARPGVPENVVWGRMIAELIERGGDQPSVLLWSAGPEQGKNVFQPGTRVLEKGDVIGVEMDGRCQGYNGQIARQAFLGPIPSEYRELWEVQQELLGRCYQLLKPGSTLEDFVELSRSALADTEFSCRIVMHGRGLGDDPPIAIARAADSKQASWPVLNDTVFSIKPRVGRGAAEEQRRWVYWGETVVATEGGARRLGDAVPELIEIR